MNRHARQLARKALREMMKSPGAIPRKAGEPAIVAAAYAIINQYDRGPATEDEIALSRDIAAGLPVPGSWFHGGPPDMASGDWLLPPLSTGVNLGDQYRVRWHFVYVSSRREVAAMYAAQRPGGVVYRVEPEGPLAVDLYELRAAMLLRRELKGESLDVGDVNYVAFTCPRARVLEVLG